MGGWERGGVHNVSATNWGTGPVLTEAPPDLAVGCNLPRKHSPRTQQCAICLSRGFDERRGWLAPQGVAEPGHQAADHGERGGRSPSRCPRAPCGCSHAAAAPRHGRPAARHAAAGGGARGRRSAAHLCRRAAAACCAWQGGHGARGGSARGEAASRHKKLSAANSRCGLFLQAGGWRGEAPCLGAPATAAAASKHCTDFKIQTCIALHA